MKSNVIYFILSGAILFSLYSCEDSLNEETYQIKTAGVHADVFGTEDTSYSFQWINQKIEYLSNKNFIQIWVEFNDKGITYNKVLFTWNLPISIAIKEKRKPRILTFETFQKIISNRNDRSKDQYFLKFVLRDELSKEFKIKEIPVNKITGMGSKYENPYNVDELMLLMQGRNRDSYKFKVLGKLFNSQQEAQEFLKK